MEDTSNYELKVRQHVSELKRFFTNLVIYCSIFVLCLIVWLVTGAGSFWPVWVLLSFGAASILQAAKLGQIPMIEEYLTFLKPEWEEDQVQDLLKKNQEK
ncbi:MAG TPA: 2TM domain-containing protein [Alphaproteobacteria bacterium]|nr:2TM domain-containing protein [Alphaproteobacteria bacterium]